LEKAKELLNVLVELGLCTVDASGGLSLTPDGRRSIKVILAGGVFDIIHSGHIYTLEKAKSLGDALVVSVARDKIVKELRGKPPMNPETERARLVQSIKYVDAAILSSETDPLGAIREVRPDIVAVGYDQKHDEEEIITRAKESGLKVIVTRLDSPVPGIKSTKIKRDRRAMRSF
jgi:cytidyltransferase-like protein